MILKSTGQTIFTLPWSATATKPWSNEYERIIIPATQLLHKNSIQIVHKSSVE